MRLSVRRRPGERGYTMVELMVGMLLGLTAMGAFVSFNRAQMMALVTQSSQIDVQTVGRNLTDLFARETRRAGMDPACVKTFEGLAEGRADQLRIKADVNGNGVIDGGVEDVTYTINTSSSTIQRVAGTSTETLVSGMSLSGSLFRYYDGAGTELVPATGNPPALTQSQRTQARRVRLELALQDTGIDPLGATQQLVASFASNVNLRNRFFVNTMTCP